MDTRSVRRATLAVLSASALLALAGGLYRWETVGTRATSGPAVIELVAFAAALCVPLFLLVWDRRESLESSRRARPRARADGSTSQAPLLETLVENIPAGVMVEDADRRLRFTNRRFCELFDFEATPDELVGTDCEVAAERVRERFVDGERFVERTNAVVAGETPADRETYDLVDGRTLERSAVPIPLDDGQTGWLWIYRDVTDRVRTERRLDALHGMTRELMAAPSHEAIATLTSEAAVEILDMPHNGVHFYDAGEDALVPVAWSQATEELVGEVPTFTAENSLAWETFATGEAHTYRDVSEREGVYDPETPIRSEIQLPLGEHGVLLIGDTSPDAFDQTAFELAKLLATNAEAALDRADREQALRERETQLEYERDRFATLFQHVPDPAVIVEFGGEEPVVRAVNGAFEERFGYTEDDAVGRALNDLIVPDGERADAEAIDRRARTGEQVVREVRRRTADGEVREFLFRNVPIDGDTAQAYGIYTEITDRKRRERRLQRQNDRLEQFANVLSHDLRNPLNVATGRLELFDVEGPQREHVRAIRNAHDRMEALVDDLLTLARQGQTVGETTPVSIADVATRAWSQISSPDATLEVDTDVTVSADESRLQQLLENLFRNAVEHGGDGVTVRVGSLADGAGFYVADDGPGIPPAERERVFEHGYSTASDGTGFGLAIAREIAEAHGWSIAVSASDAGGARFEIRDVSLTE